MSFDIFGKGFDGYDGLDNLCRNFNCFEVGFDCFEKGLGNFSAV